MRSDYTKLLELIQRSPGVLARAYETRMPDPEPHDSRNAAGGKTPDTRAAKSAEADPRPGSDEDSMSAKTAPSGRTAGREKQILPAKSIEDIPAKPLTREDLLPLVALERSKAIEAISTLVRDCKLCRLCEKRNKSVPGTGSLTPSVLVIGEGPGADEDRLGLPFVGAAGQYLDKWLDAIGQSRYRNAYIANVVKCRPPNNRDPQPDEIESCTPYLDAQIDILKPKAILVVGRVAAGYLLGREVRMNEVRGKIYSYRGVKFMPTYHPAAVLRTPDLKRAVWEDLKSFKQGLLDGNPEE